MSLDKTVAILASDSYLPRLKVCIDSIRKHSPDIPINILYFGDREEICGYSDHLIVTSSTRLEVFKDIFAARPAYMIQLLRQGYNSVLHIGADVIFYSPVEEIFEKYSQYDAAGSPHIITPIPYDGTVPSNEQIHLTGQLNSDFMLWNYTKSTLEFLEWQHNELKRSNEDAPSRGQFFDQVYLSFAPYFIENFHIMRDTDQNVAYYNLHERDIEAAKSIQYSGYSLRERSRLSRYMRRLSDFTIETVKRAISYGDAIEDAGEKL